MADIFIISDTHFGHQNACKFLRKDGVTKLRPWDNAEEMDEALIENWNKVVKPNSKVYHLGDVVINRRALSTLYRLNGDKVLIKGNHDIFKLSDYIEHFRDIRAYHVMDKLIFSHIPVHPESQGRFRGNVHGHLHDKRVLVKNQYNQEVVDPFYFNASVESINYTPIAFEEIRKYFKGD